MEYERIIYKPGRVTQIIMKRPHSLNAISHPMYMEMEDAFDRAAADKECRVIVLSGAGRCFSASHDIRSPEARTTINPVRTLDARPGELVAMEQRVKELGSEEAANAYYWDEHNYYAFEMKLRKWRNIPQPTIAMVHNYCIYGALFSAAAMDLIFASEDAMFVFPFGQYDTGVWDLGPRKIKELFFEHRAMPAREAYECGFVSRIYPTREILERETLAFAERVAENAQITMLRTAKRAINHTMDIQGYSIALEAANTAYRLMNASTTKEEHEEVMRMGGPARVSRALENLEIKRKAEKMA
jgi:enoyl-CoA hydratase